MINSIESYRFEEEKDKEVMCSVCHEGLKQDNMVKRLVCNHEFHTKCINTWLKSSKLICPNCRAPVTK